MIFNSLHCEPIVLTNTSWKRIFEFGLDFDLAVSIGEKKRDTLQGLLFGKCKYSMQH